MKIPRIVNKKLGRCIWLLFATSLNLHPEHLIVHTKIYFHIFFSDDFATDKDARHRLGIFCPRARSFACNNIMDTKNNWEGNQAQYDDLMDCEQKVRQVHLASFCNFVESVSRALDFAYKDILQEMF